MKQVSLEKASRNLRSLFLEAADDDGINVIDTDGRELGVLLNCNQFRSMQIRSDLASDPNRLVEIMDAHHRFQQAGSEGFEDYKFG